MGEIVDKPARSHVRGSSIALFAGLAAAAFIVTDRRAMLRPIFGDDGATAFLTTAPSGGGVRYVGFGRPRAPAVTMGNTPRLSGIVPGALPIEQFAGIGGPETGVLPPLESVASDSGTPVAGPLAGGLPTGGLPGSRPPATQPPVTQPPVTQPPVTQPPVTQPPVTQPPVTQPPVTQPPVVQPPVTQPPIVEPPVSPIPEPATWAMLLLGFGTIGIALRRRVGRSGAYRPATGAR